MYEGRRERGRVSARCRVLGAGWRAMGGGQRVEGEYGFEELNGGLPEGNAGGPWPCHRKMHR
jgi:hypothetical protein